MDIDAKIISLYKLHIPKTECFKNLICTGNKDEIKQRCYVTMGHYDLIDIADVDMNVDKKNDEHFLSYVHRCLQKMRNVDGKVNRENFTSQNMIVFVNTFGEYGFSQETINEFWDNREDENDSHLLFVSMLHINDCKTVEETDCNTKRKIEIESIIKKIKEIYDGKKYIFYFTFDYSDIIIFCKTNNVKDYIHTINSLSFNKDANIRDSFTLYGICRSYLLDEFDKIKEIDDKLSSDISNEEKNFYEEKLKKYIIPDDENEEYRFYLKVNIGVQYYYVLDDFREKVSKYKEHFGVELINQIGRNDFSVISKKATLNWLIYIEYLIDTHTDTLLDRLNESMVFNTFEAFVGCEEDIQDDTASEKISFSLLKMNDYLTEKCNSFKAETIKQLGDDNAANFYLPVMEVGNSMKSIIKNQFADDFVMCMYESFCHFIDYMHIKINGINDVGDKYKYITKFEATFNEYFKGIISLVNSAMHANRSFIQVTDFNAIFYDVPPKLMSFYTAVVYELRDIIKDVDKFEYTFLFTPNFSNNITVSRISYPTEIPEDRLLLISINETFFYKPSVVISTAAHEIAHFVGDLKRSRVLRTKRFIKCIVLSILDSCLPNELSVVSNMLEMINEISENLLEIIEKKGNLADRPKLCYDDKYIDLINYICMLFYSSKKIENLIRDYISSYLKKENKENEIRQAVYSDRVRWVNNINEYLFRIYKVNIERNNLGNTCRMNNINKNLNNVSDVFKESYADIQMIILLNLNFKDYMDKFLFHENIDIAKLKEPIHISRIAVAIKLMIAMQAWSMEDMTLYFSEGKYKDNSDCKEFVDNVILILRAIDIFCGKGSELLSMLEDVKEGYREFCEKTKCYILPKAESKYWKGNNKNKDDKEENKMVENFYHAQEYLYLLEVACKTLDYYNSNADKLCRIKALRDNYNCINRFKDINEVYTMVRTTMEDYKHSLIEKLQK